MAQHTEVRLVDDLDGTDAEETIAFGLDGKTYEIDLSTVNAQTLREALAPFVAAARVVRRPGRRQLASVPTGSAAVAKRAPRGEAQEKRAWLAANGWPELANKRGRFSVEQDAAWESQTPRGEAPGEAPQSGGTVAGASPTVEGPDSGEDAAEAAGKTGGGKGNQADDSPQVSGKRTRVSKLTVHQVSVVKGCTDLVIKAGSTWALLAGAPDDVVAAIEEIKATAALGLAEKQRLSHVARKVASGEGVQVVDAA